MIQFKQVWFDYPHTERTNRTALLQNVNIQIERGEFIAIVGANGSGKSTLAKLMNGILLPTQGEIRVDGLSTQVEEHLHQIRQKIGLVFQNPENQMVATTVLDDVAFGLENIGFASEGMIQRIKEALDKVGMWEYQEAEPHHLSGGQKQRVAIAGMLAMRPEVIIFDEATSMLDPQGRKEILQIMKELYEDGLTIIHITHDMNDAVEASRIIVMNDGQIMKDTAPEMFIADSEWLRQQHLEPPFFVEVKDKLVQYGLHIPSSIKTKKELIAYLWTLS